jgi:predicted ATPase
MLRSKILNLKVASGVSLQKGLRRFSESIKSSPSLLDAYKNDVNAGELEYDERQYHVLRYLNRLSDHISSPGYSPNIMPYRYEKKIELPNHVDTGPKVVHFTGPPTERIKKKQPTTNNNVEIKSSSSSPNVKIVKGLYIYGEVGTGKTLLMDKFYNSCNIPSSKKKRIHFHEFLLNLHKKIRSFKQNLIKEYGRDMKPQINLNISSERDAIEQIAIEISKETWLLCFDEFQVTDVADALILRKFFDCLWDHGTILVATSNRPPEDLYKNGINRSYFVPFIERLLTQNIICDINSNIDYRSKVVSTQDCYIIIPELLSLSENEIKLRRTKQLWCKFLSISNDDYTYKMTDASDDVSNISRNSNSDSDSNIADNNNDINFEKMKKNYKLPFSLVVPIMMGRSMVVDYAFPRLPTSELHTPPLSKRLSLHNTDRVIGDWPEEGNLDNDSKNKEIIEKLNSVNVNVARDDDDNNTFNKSGVRVGSSRGVGWFTFNFLCENERGASDYQAICKSFDTIFIDNIPNLSVLEHDKARRFIILIDTLYDNHVRLYWSCANHPKELFLKINPYEIKDNVIMQTSFGGIDHEWKEDSMSSLSLPSNSKSPSSSASASNEMPVALHARGSEQFSTKKTVRLSSNDGCKTKSYNIPLETQIESQTLSNPNPNADADAVEGELDLLEGELASVQELSFAFRRAASRLIEMAGSEYHRKWENKGIRKE